MGLISRIYDFVNGTMTADGDHVDAELNLIHGVINGNIENVNVKAGAAILFNKLANAPQGLLTAQVNDAQINFRTLKKSSVSWSPNVTLTPGNSDSFFTGVSSTDSIPLAIELVKSGLPPPGVGMEHVKLHMSLYRDSSTNFYHLVLTNHTNANVTITAAGGGWIFRYIIT